MRHIDGEKMNIEKQGLFFSWKRGIVVPVTKTDVLWW